MDRKSLSLGEFIADYRFRGNWKIQYTDTTHLEKDVYVKLGDLSIDSEEAIEDYPILPFSFKPVSDHDINDSLSELTNHKGLRRKAKKYILDQLAESLVRTGLMRPELRLMKDHAVQRDFRKVLENLSSDGYLILVVDTGALRKGAISFLQKTLSNVLIWSVVPVFVMTELQRQVGELNKKARGKTHFGNCDSIRERPQVSCISRELNHLRRWRPVEWLTAFPEHLGQMDGTSKVDRLIIESVKDLKRKRGLHRGVYLLTGDKDMASLAMLENVNSLYVGGVSLPDDIYSVRYDSFQENFVLTPIHLLLWDLTQVFSTIRMQRTDQDQQYEFRYYSKMARDGFFAYDVMEIREH
jgi:hypothetical protein